MPDVNEPTEPEVPQPANLWESIAHSHDEPTSEPSSPPTPEWEPTASHVPPNSPNWTLPPSQSPIDLDRPQPGRGGVRLLVGALAIALALTAGVGIGHIWWSTASGPTSSALAPGFNGFGNQFPSGNGSSGNTSNPGPADVSSIASKIDPALVDVNVTLEDGAAAGTGIVLTASGEILTNNHVVEGATSISVTDVGNGKTYSATVVGYDRSSDVAVIQLAHASGLTTATIAPGSGSVNQDVVAVGNAGGTGGTPTAAGGTITALSQSITASDESSGTSENLTGLIETNADVQAGDSGGSLVDTSGRVVGMDTATSGGFLLSSQSTQGYAIPIHEALSIATQIEAGGRSSTVHVGPTAYLGVLVSSGPSNGYGGFGFGYSGSSPTTVNGAYIVQIVSGTPASSSGLVAGDVITSVAGTHISTPSGLTAALLNYVPGDRVSIGYTTTSGATESTSLVLGSGPAQ